MNSTLLISHENIARRAYQIWEEAGQPEGDGTEFWLRAEHELRAEHAKAGDGNGAQGKSVWPPLDAKHVSVRAPHSSDYVHPGVTTDSMHHHRKR